MFIEGLAAKAKRQLTMFLPVADDRVGQCNRCGDCCKLPYPCPFLRYDENNHARCAVYHFRPPSCRVYPRTAGEHRTKATCGFSFTSDLQPQPVTVSASADKTPPAQ